MKNLWIKTAAIGALAVAVIGSQASPAQATRCMDPMDLRLAASTDTGSMGNPAPAKSPADAVHGSGTGTEATGKPNDAVPGAGHAGGVKGGTGGTGANQASDAPGAVPPGGPGGTNAH